MGLLLSCYVASVLNAELPQNTRYHIVQEFNRGVYDYIIATDDASKIRTATTSAGNGELDGLPASAQPGEEVASAGGSTDGAAATTSKKKRKQRPTDAEYGVARGIDFQDVAVVYNFDFPPTVASYTHRVRPRPKRGPLQWSRAPC